MRSRMLRALSVATLLCALSAVVARAQESRIAPIFPRENPNIVFVEAEEALSTNFATEPTLNYSASGKRTLQLSTTADVRGEGGYYADYVFQVPSTGTWELWYAGTPAGPLEDVYPSFFSPFRYRLDDRESIPVYREDIVVNENYAPSFYWNRVQPVDLEQGVHRLRFEVREKRRYDNRYYFYLDAFFLVRTLDGVPLAAAPLPEVFPSDPGSTAIDRPFRSIDDYLVIVNQATERTQRVSRQVELATVYSMVGDYVNALRYLSRAALLEPESPTILLLQAKNQIWKGDLADGIATYKKLLELTPERADLWVEAGKIAAWIARYDDSVDILSRGLERFPGDLDLMVNLGLTYLWSSRPTDADRMFRLSRESAQGDLDRLKYLAGVYRVNGYPELAVEIYRLAIETDRADLESYLLLEGALRALGRTQDADEVRRTVESTFQASGELDAYLATYRVKQGLVQATIEGYASELAANPDNLDLRQHLAQTYFWNGLQAEAIREYLNILVNNAYRELRRMDSETAGVQEALDLGYLVSAFLAGAPEGLRAARAEVESRRKDMDRAAADLARAEDAAAKATEAAAENAAELEAAAQSRREAWDQAAANAAAAVGAAQDLVGRLDEVETLLEAWRAEVAALGEAEAEAERLFRDLIKASRWSWDRKAALAEATTQAGEGLVIAHYVVARIAQIERRWPVAYASWTPLGDTDAAYTAGRSQTVLWEGKQGAGGWLEALRDLPSDAVPYADRVLDAAGRLGLGGERAATVFAGTAEETYALLGDLSARLGAAPAALEATRKTLTADLRGVHRYLAQALVRAYYRCEENTVGLRNELGDFYLKASNRVAAIRQYRYVLAIDPTNLDAMFRLGSTSSLAGDWSEALRYYELVWSADPLFSNVAALYNRIAQDHGDTVEVTGAYRADTAHVGWTGSARYTLPVASFLGIQAGYEVSSNRAAEILPNEYFPDGVAYHMAWGVQTVGVGLPITFYGTGPTLTVTPRVGVDLVLDSQYFAGDPGDITFPTGDLFDPDLGSFGPFDFLGGHTLRPFVGASAELAVPDAVRVSATARLGTYAQTLPLPKTPRIAVEGSVGVSPVFTFLDVPVLRDLYLRTYGEIAVLPAAPGADTNLIWLAAQDLVVPFRGTSAVSPGLAVEASFYYTDSTATAVVWEYYSPQESLAVKGGLTGSLSLPVGKERLGLSLRAAGGYTASYDPQALARVSFVLVEGNLGVTLSRRAGTLGLRAAFSGSIGTADGTLDYWSLTVALDLTSRLTRLLAAM